MLRESGYKMQLLKNKVVKNASWIIMARVAQMVISLFIGMVTARYLGPSNYGIINYTESIVAFFLSICTLGLDGIIVKELLDRPSEEGNTLGTAIGLRMISSAISVVLIVLLITFLKPRDPLYGYVAFIQSLALMFQSFEIIQYWYQSKLMSKTTAIVQFIAYIGKASYRIVILVLEKDVIWFAAASVIDAALIAVMLFFVYKYDCKQKLHFCLDLGQRMLKCSYHFILSGLMVAIYNQMDKVMLGNMLDDTAVGYYSAASTICNIWAFVLMAIIDSGRPVIMESYSLNREKFKKRLRQLYAVIFWIGVAVSLVLSIGGKLVIRILYGVEYLPAAGSLAILTWYTGFSYLGVARSIWLICEGKQRYEKVFAAVGAVVNLIMNAVLIPVYGIRGAAAATLFTRIVTDLVAPLVLKNTRENSIIIIEAILLRDVLPTRGNRNL